MTELIVWTSILGYLSVGAMLHPKFALAQYNANKNKRFGRNTPSEAAGYAVLQALIWPAFFLIWRSTGLINKDIELQAEMKKVREQIEEQKRLERRKAQDQLADFDRRMREIK